MEGKLDRLLRRFLKMENDWILNPIFTANFIPSFALKTALKGNPIYHSFVRHSIEIDLEIKKCQNF